MGVAILGAILCKNILRSGSGRGAREFAKTQAEADLAPASGQNTACGLHAEALPVWGVIFIRITMER
jgi:hypothetical protein